MTQIYEGMFLLDNNVVRQDWRKAKDVVKATLEKHGGTIHTVRRWDERRLAYPINRNHRATFFLSYYEMPADSIPTMRRDLDLSEDVMRYLFTAVDGVPEEERAKAALEEDKDYIVPEPPADNEPEPEPEGDERGSSDRRPRGDKPAERGQRKEAEAAPAAAETPAETAAETPAETAAEPAAETTAEPPAETAAEPAAETAAEPAAEAPATEPEPSKES